MRGKLQNILTNVFGLFVSISVLGGIVVFIAYVFGIIVGGEIGTIFMVTAWAKLSPYFIKSATIAVLSGLILFYISGEHPLSLKEEQKNVNC